MITIAHLSDLHFGADVPEIAEALVRDLHALQPTVVAFSGDATQRALEHQFRAARGFLDRLPTPLVSIPGNHDIPLYNVAARAVAPYKGYRAHIDNNLQPAHLTDALALVSISTARHYFWKDGSVSAGQRRRVGRVFGTAAPSACRVVMMHHPCMVPPEFPVHNRVDRADAALTAMSRAGVEVVLAGHMHDAFVVRTAVRPDRPMPIILSQAGTAISRRRRSQPNSYNIVRIADATITVTIRRWDGREFADGTTHPFARVARPG